MAGKSWLCGERFTLADIHLYAFLSFAIERGVASVDGLPNVSAWLQRVAARPSAKA